MVRTQHDAHLDEAGGVFGELALEPQQGDDVAHILVARHQGGHVHPMVCGLLPSVIADCGDNVGRDPHLNAVQAFKPERRPASSV